MSRTVKAGAPGLRRQRRQTRASYLAKPHREPGIPARDNISGLTNERYEEAIFDKRGQILQTITALNTLQSLLENDLTTFIKTYVKD